MVSRGYDASSFAKFVREEAYFARGLLAEDRRSREKALSRHASRSDESLVTSNRIGSRRFDFSSREKSSTTGSGYATRWTREIWGWHPEAARNGRGRRV